MKASIVTVLFNLAAAALSQNLTSSSLPQFPCLLEKELDTFIPACALDCQQRALDQDGCEDYNDIACHCSRTWAIGEVFAPCLFTNSSCGTNDTAALFQIIDPVCAYFNMTSNGTLPKPECPSSDGSCTAQTVTVTVTSIPGPSTTASRTSNLTTTATSIASIVPFTGIGIVLSPSIGINLLLGLVGFVVFQF